jgi:hypothetical protein
MRREPRHVLREVMFVKAPGATQQVAGGMGLRQPHGGPPRALLKDACHDLPPRHLASERAPEGLSEPQLTGDVGERADRAHREAGMEFQGGAHSAQDREVVLVAERQPEGFEFLRGAMREVRNSTILT